MTTKTTYKTIESGIKEETQASVKRRLSDLFGFMPSRIVLLEGGCKCFDGTDGIRYYFYTDIAFAVNGIGYKSDFVSLMMDESYNF